MVEYVNLPGKERTLYVLPSGRPRLGFFTSSLLVSNLVVSALSGASLGPQPCEAEAGQKEPSSGVALKRDCKCLLC